MNNTERLDVFGKILISHVRAGLFYSKQRDESFEVKACLTEKSFFSQTDHALKEQCRKYRKQAYFLDFLSSTESH